MSIGKNIEILRKKNNLKQSELGAKLHVTNKTISSWENGRTEPNIGMIEKMCSIFNCSKTDIIDGLNIDAKTVLTRIDHAIDMLNACEDDRDAEFFAKISKDRTFMKYIGVLNSLKDEFKEQVYDYIEYTLNKEKNGESKISELYKEG